MTTGGDRRFPPRSDDDDDVDALAGQLLFTLFVGPFVAGLLLAKMFDLDDDLPAVLRITRVRFRRAIAIAVVMVVVFLAIVSHQVMGPRGCVRRAGCR